MKADRGVRMYKCMQMLMSAWGCCPELRLGQMISNACQHYGITEQQFFYMEDEELVDKIYAWCSALAYGN